MTLARLGDDAALDIANGVPSEEAGARRFARVANRIAFGDAGRRRYVVATVLVRFTTRTRLGD